jgi:hypothetical protein
VTDSELHVECRAADHGWLCRVTVSEGVTHTEHEVSVSEAELKRYGATGTSPVALVGEAFAFLLDREPKESILPSFAVSDIERYFPEFGRRRSSSE